MREADAQPPAGDPSGGRPGAALVLGDSGGIGAALAEALGAQGRAVTGLSRRDGLDLTDEASIMRAANGLAGQRFGLIFNATGGLELGGAGPEKSLAAIDPAAMAAQFALNAIGVALALKHFSPLLGEERPVFASLSARLGSIGDNRLGGWISYRASKAAQNQILRTAAIELARTRPGSIVVALHPGTVRTPLTAAWAATRKTVSPQEAASGLLRVIAGLTPDDSGSFHDATGKPIPW